MQVTGPLVSTIRNKNPGPGSYQMPSTLCKSISKHYSRPDNTYNTIVACVDICYSASLSNISYHIKLHQAGRVILTHLLNML